jgi:two-component system response regulator AdeR
MPDLSHTSTFNHERARGSQALILIAEDEPEIAEILTAYLARNNFRTIQAADGQRALELHQQLKPDLLLLDVQMPYFDGWQVLAEIRHRGNTPVIMLTALDQDIDKLMGLRIGADDYVVKPFNPAEVVARVQAVLRRTSALVTNTETNILRADNFEIDLEQHEVNVLIENKQYTLTLTLAEFKLLAHLAKAPRKVFSRMELLTNCLPEGDTLERTVDSHISKLRKKLEDIGVTGVPTSVRGVGYKFGATS